MKKLLIFTISIVLLLSLVIAMKPSFNEFTVTKPNSHNPTVIIPNHAIQVAPHVFSLGTTLDKHSGKIVEGLLFVHDATPKTKKAKPGTVCGNGICEAGENAKKCAADCSGGDDTGSGDSTCYSEIGKGAVWKDVEDYIVDTTNTVGLSDSFVRTQISDSIDQWEDAADGAIDGIQGANIIGNEIAGIVDGADETSTDGKNEILFGDLDSNTIGVTIVWGIFRGPPSGRELVEADQVYNQVDFDWSEDCTEEDCVSLGLEKMDFWNIAQHELGHWLGLSHPPDTCNEETMYAFSSYGEISSRDLNFGDIAGVDFLY